MAGKGVARVTSELYTTKHLFKGGFVHITGADRFLHVATFIASMAGTGVAMGYIRALHDEALVQRRMCSHHGSRFLHATALAQWQAKELPGVQQSSTRSRVCRDQDPLEAGSYVVDAGSHRKR